MYIILYFKLKLQKKNLFFFVAECFTGAQKCRKMSIPATDCRTIHRMSICLSSAFVSLSILSYDSIRSWNIRRDKPMVPWDHAMGRAAGHTCICERDRLDILWNVPLSHGIVGWDRGMGLTFYSISG